MFYAVQRVIRRHIPCPVCSFDLHGQTGDPVYCPECGEAITRQALARGTRFRRRRRLSSTELAVLLIGGGLLAGLLAGTPSAGWLGSFESRFRALVIPAAGGAYLPFVAASHGVRPSAATLAYFTSLAGGVALTAGPLALFDRIDLWSLCLLPASLLAMLGARIGRVGWRAGLRGGVN